MTVVTGISLWPVCAAQDGCYTAGGVAGIVIATIIVTLIFGGLIAAVARYLWKHRTAPYKGGEKVTLPETCLPEKQPIGPKTDYAFDNPYFKDDDGGDQGATPDAAEKGEAGFASDRGDNDNSQNSKNNSGSKLKKHKPFANIPFYSVFGQGYKKTKSMDDTFISKQQSERISVPLRGHDFTGLGFNICGNMRDGIFIKDVLHRGPASESGKIKAGDRIISVTVSFGSIVYEDALTILSYASPYDVKLEIEEGGEKNVLLATSSPGKRLASASFRNGGQRLFHPLYRSQSIDDLTQIGKESFLLQSKSAGSSSNYKRSQSIQAPASKTRPQLKLSESAPDTQALDSSKRSRQSSTSSGSSSSKKISIETLENSSCEELTERKEVPDAIKSDLAKDSLLKFENVPLVTSEKVIGGSTSSEPLVQENIQKQEISDVFENMKHSAETCAQQRNLEESAFDLPMPKAPPRKQNTPGKRKAPSPPKLRPNPAATEISAVVHQVDEAMEYHLSASPANTSMFLTNVNTGSPENSEIGARTPKNVEILTSEGSREENFEKTENSTSTSGSSLDSNAEMSEPPSPKRKASSLGDLTKLNESRNKNVSSTILERAVSLDLQQQQSVPESNLERQKKILKPPAFNPEDTSEEDFENVKDQEISTKDWEIGDPWEKLPVSRVDNSDCDLVMSEGTSVVSPSKNTLDSSSITNGHHPTLNEVCSKLDDTSTACAKIKGDTSSPGLSLSASISSTHSENEYQNNTSTPARKIVEFDTFFEGNSPIQSSERDKEGERENSLEEKAKLASGGSDNTTLEKTCGFGRNTHSLSVPVSLSIPIIPPVIHHYEKLSISPSSNSQGQKDILDNSRQDSEEKDIPSLYKPVFLPKQLKTTHTVLTMSLSSGAEPVTAKNEGEPQESWSSKEKDSALSPSNSVNGDEAELSSIGQYRTAVEFPTVSDNTVFITSKLCNISSSLSLLPTEAANKYSSPEISETSIHGKDFSHAKKETASAPSGEDLSLLKSGSDSPPPHLEPPQ